MRMFLFVRRAQFAQKSPKDLGGRCMTVALGTGRSFIFNGFNTGLMNQYRENTVHSRYGYGQINTPRLS